MMYGYNPNYGAMMAPEYMQQPCGMQQPIMPQPCGMQKPMMQQPMMPQPCGMQKPMIPQPCGMPQPYPVPTYPGTMPQNNGVMPAGQMPLAANYSTAMPYPNGMTPIQPNAMTPIQQVPYPTYPTPTPSYPTAVNPVQQPYPAYQTPICGGCLKPVHTCCCGQPVQPIAPIPPAPTYPVQPVPLMVEEPVMTTTNYKKTTYLEAYVPVESDVPIMQNVVEPKPTKPTQGKPVPMSETPVNNYNMYMQDRAVTPSTNQSITCQNLPLAQSYVQPQSYVNFNDPESTLEQGTYFAELYRPYMGGYLK